LETSNFIACFSAIGKHKWKLITNERSCNELSFKGIENKIYKKFEGFSDYTICNSNVARDLWIKHIPKFKDKIGVIYNYIDISYIYDDVEYTPLNNGVVNISVVASYQYIKNVVTVVKALSMLTDEERKKLKINWYGRIEVVEGDTRAYDEACELINYYSLNSIIELHKENKNIYSIMKQSDFVGLFSVYEGLPNVICEALCLGKHIIMTPVSDYSILLKNNGIFCESFDACSIAAMLKSAILLNKDTILKIGYASKQIANNLFDSDNIYRQWNDIFVNLE